MRIRDRRPERGQDLVEYAITLTLFLFLVFMIVDLGRVVYYFSAVQNSAREGARYGVIHPADTGGIQARVRFIAAGLDTTDLTITTSYPTTRTIQVRVQYPFEPVTPFAGEVLGMGPDDTITLQGSSTLHIEQ